MIETEYFEGRSVDEERKTMAPYWVIALAILFGIALAMLPIYGHAEPLAAATDASGARIVIHTEPCACRDTVDLTNRATWEEGDKVLEGCAGVASTGGAFIFYFHEDKSVFPIPKSAFKLVVNA